MNNPTNFREQEEKMKSYQEPTQGATLMATPRSRKDRIDYQISQVIKQLEHLRKQKEYLESHPYLEEALELFETY